MQRQIARFFLVLALIAIGVALPARAQANHRRLEWNPDWRRVSAAEYFTITGLVTGHLAIRYLIPPADGAIWTRPVWFDAGMREALVIESRQGRKIAGRASDYLALATLLQPFLVDSIIVAGIADRNSDVALQMGVISVQSYSITLVLNTAAKRFFARERPFGSACAKDPGYTDNCAELDRFRSYYSGHAAITATGAGLTCAHHTHLPLYGGGIADLGACLGALAGTLTTGALRIAADKHWATDVLTGHIIGFAAGYLLPSLLYYRGFEGTPDETTQALSAPQPLVSYSGSF